MVRNVSGNWVRQYNLSDHLGNTRAVLEPNGSVLQQTDYYPFGSAFAVANTTKNKYLYGGKELQDEVLGGTQLYVYDFEARFFDGRYVPRFMSIDPLAEKRFSISPYAYCSNNPVNKIDPDGRDDYYTREGVFLFRDDQRTDYIIIRQENTFVKNLNALCGLNLPEHMDTRLMDITLTAEAYSNIFTDILDRSGLDVGDLKNGAVSVNVQSESGSEWSITDDYNEPSR